MRIQFMMQVSLKRSLKRFAYTALLFSLCGFLAASKPPSLLEKIQDIGHLTITSRNGPTTFYEGQQGLTGFEYTLAKSFADELGLELVIENEDDLGTLIKSVYQEDIQLAAAGLTVTDKRKDNVLFSTPYFDITQQVIYRSDSNKPVSVEDLLGQEILVIADSAHAERLRELQIEHPDLQWKEQAGLEMIDLVEMVHSGDIQYAIVDSNAFLINRNVYPRARAAFDISEPQQLAWAFPKQSDPTLFNAAEKFFARIQTDGTLEKIHDKFYGETEQFNHSGALLFANRVESRLPKWESHLKQAGAEHNLDWRLLAAISYQESHWNARARSHTGVRGLMMLTQATAKDMGITNRVDPEQSIKGGAKYFKSIFNRIPERIQGLDRTWMALAAYNVGFGHLEDARVLTEKHGENPNKWDNVRRYLPLLSKRKYYKNTKHGYARGWEPVEYVENIQHYYTVLNWHEHMEVRRLAAAEEAQSVITENTQESQAAMEATASVTAFDKISLSL
ncbi:MAG: membrane-bound lytic murein transglycosylase MltF [Cellvibrionaceae bacterium]